MKTAIFAHPKEALPAVSLLPNKLELFSKLREREVQPVVTFGGEQAFTDSGVETHELLAEDATRHVGEIALDQVGVIVNRLDRSVKKDEMPDAWNQAQIPVANENELRSLVFRKHRVQDEILAPIELGMPSLLVESVADALVFMDLNPSDSYIIKPTSGTFSKGVDKVAAAGVVDYVTNSDKLGSIIMQPAFDFTHPMPDSMQPYDRDSRDGFEVWAQSNATKELRMYGFFDGIDTDVFPVGRAMKDGEDHWFFVDPNSVQEALFEDTKRVFSRAAQLTGSRAIYGALDIGYGNNHPNQEPGYHVVELNGRMPYMIGYDKHAGVANVLRDKFADQLQRVVERPTDGRVE